MGKRCLAFWLFLFAVLSPLPVQAQDDSFIAYGATVSGRLTNSSPRATHMFEGLRGEVIGLDFQVTGGNLDPVITLVDDAGVIVAHYDDQAGSRVPQVPSLRIPRSARYTILVTRFGYELGSTTGSYNLTLERIGVSSISGSMLRYGDQVINTINDMSPQLYYSFRAQRGDIVNVRMRRVSGDLDPYLQVVDREAFVLADNDDTLGAPVPFDSTIAGLVIEEDGVYVIVASRYGQAAGTSAGNFVLTVEEADNSGLGNSPQTAEPLLLGSTAEGELSNQQFAQYYRFEAQADDIVTIRMNRGATGALDSFVVLADAGLSEIISDDDSGGGQNAEITQYRIPADGTYYIIATRFEREAGTSSGAYRLELLSLGNAFDGVPEGMLRISPGTTITGRIDDTTPDQVYAFWATAGDTITVSMNRGDGNLDPVVSIEDAEGNTLARDDDSGGGQNARISAYTIPETGTYTIRATRYTGDTGPANTEGSFVLVLARRLN
jgi:hypothetical protein